MCTSCEPVAQLPDMPCEDVHRVCLSMPVPFADHILSMMESMRGRVWRTTHDNLILLPRLEVTRNMARTGFQAVPRVAHCTGRLMRTQVGI